MSLIRATWLGLCLGLALGARILQTSDNLIGNGNWSETSLTTQWQTLYGAAIAPWQAQQVEVGEANFYNPKWGLQGYVAMLYPGSFNSISQQVTCGAKRYMLRYQWAFSPAYAQVVTPKVTWNGVVVRTLTANDTEVHLEQIAVPGLLGTNTLMFQAQGAYTVELLHHSVTFRNVSLVAAN